MKGSLYALVYAAVLGTVCALLLTAAADVTAPYRQANAEAEKVRNILAVLEVPLPPDTSAKELKELFKMFLSEQRKKKIYCLIKSGIRYPLEIPKFLKGEMSRSLSEKKC